ncbi:hypothetical protein ACSDBR_11185 [Acidithiobacillus ferriphilus]|uniref:hypothetical protein n=1 Tax=Acidithiobacillus ferriphilus TaxID=1689834 RepID=UPI00390C5F83
MSTLQPAQEYRPFVHRLLVVDSQSIRNALALRQGHPGNNIAYAPADHPRIADLLARAAIATHHHMVTAPGINP